MQVHVRVITPQVDFHRQLEHNLQSSSSRQCNPVRVEDLVQAWDAADRTRLLQDAVRTHDRDFLDDWVSDRMIWVMPLRDNQRGKREWIDASCSVAWDWFDVQILREVDLGDARLVEAWIRQQYRRTNEAGPAEEPTTVTADGVVVDLWAREGGRWRLVARHPQRAEN